MDDERIEALIDEADALVDEDDLAGAEAKTREALGLLAAMGALDALQSLQHRQLQDSLATLLSKRGAFSEARALLDGLLRTAKDLDVKWDALTSLAELERAEGRRDEAVRWLAEALELAERGGPALRGTVVTTLERLEAVLAELGDAAGVAATHERVRSERLRLLYAFYTPDDRPPLVRLRAGVWPVSRETVYLLSHGEVKTAQTFGPDDKPVEAGLRCSRIFGPVNSFECSCGKYRGEAQRGVVCEVCGIEVIDSSSRRERPAHLNLAAAVLHPRWKTVVTRFLGETEDQLLAREYLSIDWNNELIRPDDELSRALEALPRQVRAAMVLDCLPVFPAEGALRVPREAYERALAEVLAARAPAEVQQAVDRLFATFG